MGERDNKSPDKLTFTSIIADTSRDVVKAVQEFNIEKDNIITIVKDNGKYVIFCYI